MSESTPCKWATEQPAPDAAGAPITIPFATRKLSDDEMQEHETHAMLHDAPHEDLVDAADQLTEAGQRLAARVKRDYAEWPTCPVEGASLYLIAAIALPYVQPIVIQAEFWCPACAPRSEYVSGANVSRWQVSPPLEKEPTL